VGVGPSKRHRRNLQGVYNPSGHGAALFAFTARRPNLTTATNSDARWLFPGRRAGQPMTSDAFARRLRRAGVPALHGRTAAIRQLALQVLPAVVARILGYHHVHITALAAEAGSPWSHYAPDDHAE
jgi:hypothetical protein